MLAPEVRGPLEMKTLLRQSAKLNWVTPTDIGAPVHGYVVYLAKARDRSRWLQDFELPLQGEQPEAESERGMCWRPEKHVTCLELFMLEPGTPYSVQVAAVTSRGLGEKSELCGFTTRPVAPSMGVPCRFSLAICCIVTMTASMLIGQDALG